jgi:hypothetical protein
MLAATEPPFRQSAGLALSERSSVHEAATRHDVASWRFRKDARYLQEFSAPSQTMKTVAVDLET